jgi:hypothetical protein
MKNYIRLDKNIDCNYICSKVNALISSFSKELTQDSVIIIEIKNSTEYQEYPAKLEYKPID